MTGRIDVPWHQQGRGFNGVKLIRSPESGGWYALDDVGRCVANGWETATALIQALERVYVEQPYAPRKFV